MHHNMFLIVLNGLGSSHCFTELENFNLKDTDEELLLVDSLKQFRKHGACMPVL